MESFPCCRKKNLKKFSTCECQKQCICFGDASDDIAPRFQLNALHISHYMNKTWENWVQVKKKVQKLPFNVCLNLSYNLSHFIFK